MFSAFRMGPVASGRRLCDIDSVLFKVTKSQVIKIGSPGLAKIYLIRLDT